MGTLLKCNIDIETERQKTEGQRDNNLLDNDLLISKKGG